VHADTSGCRTEVEITTTTGRVNGNIDLDTVGGDIALRVPSSFQARIPANLNVSRGSRGDYRIYTDFLLSIQEDDGDIYIESVSN
jgi:hypothetical protein